MDGYRCVVMMVTGVHRQQIKVCSVNSYQDAVSQNTCVHRQHIHISSVDGCRCEVLMVAGVKCRWL